MDQDPAAEALAAFEGSDPLYTSPFIDVDEWRDTPQPHRYVHGGFEGTEHRFSFYFPPPEIYRGRFFQPLAAVSGNENSASMAMFQAGSMGFAFASGGYLVESNQGRRDMFVGDDPTITAFRASAAAARYSRVLAAAIYGPARPFGYVYGGSGGAFKTMACLERTEGVWDGGVPFVHGSPVSIPYVFTVQAHAMRVLAGKFPAIVDALEPGGSGDMYAGLNAEEAEALREVTAMGFPPRAWFNQRRIAFGYTGVFTTLVDAVLAGDPAYFEDFWTTPGYLGAEPPPSLVAARIQHPTTIAGLIFPEDARAMGIPLSMPTSQKDSGVKFPAALRLAGLPNGDLQGASLVVTSGGAAGHVFYVVAAMGEMVMLGFGEAHFQALAALREGDEIVIDNSVYLAAQTYHRHQIPGPEYRVWDQFKDAAGRPKYPQRPAALPLNDVNGGNQSGRFAGRMIVVEAMMDEAAYPWQADWYRERVRAVLGAATAERYRLYFVDNAMHTDQRVGSRDPKPVATTRVVSYQGVLQQALRDLALWVEEGVPPPPDTAYRLESGQVIVPAAAADRLGLQPVVSLSVSGGDRIEARVGAPVTFQGRITVPPGAGVVAAAEWDFEGGGDFPLVSDIEGAGATADVTATHAFQAPGTYFPALRGASRRERASADEPYGRAQNLARVRVVVT